MVSFLERNLLLGSGAPEYEWPKPVACWVPWWLPWWLAWWLAKTSRPLQWLLDVNVNQPYELQGRISNVKFTGVNLSQIAGRQPPPVPPSPTHNPSPIFPPHLPTHFTQTSPTAPVSTLHPTSPPHPPQHPPTLNHRLINARFEC